MIIREDPCRVCGNAWEFYSSDYRKTCVDCMPQPGLYVLDAPAVYGISGGGFIKIGHTLNLKKRIAVARSSFPNPLKVVFEKRVKDLGDAKEKERLLHAGLSKFQVSGEWFQDTPALRRYLRYAGINVPINKSSIAKRLGKCFPRRLYEGQNSRDCDH